MSLLDTYKAYTIDEKGERAAFEAAMVERINKAPGYKMADLMWDLYLCQKRLAALEATSCPKPDTKRIETRGRKPKASDEV